HTMHNRLAVPALAAPSGTAKTSRRTRTALMLILAVSAIVDGTCGGKKAPVARPVPPPPVQTPSSGQKSPAPPEPVKEPRLVPPEPVKEDSIASASLDDLNRNSPLKPIFFAYDSAEIDATAQSTLDADAGVLKQYPSWTITIEGHCDERGTAEYNLALGER